MVAKVNGILHLGRKGKEMVHPAVHISPWQMVEKWSEHVTQLDVGRRTRSANRTQYQPLTDLFCPHAWDNYHPAPVFLFVYNSHYKKRMISNMDYSTSAAAC